MNLLRLIFREMLHRKINAGLSALAVVAAVAFYVFFFTTGAASKNETARIMRDIGYNIRIIPKETDMTRYWAEGYSELTMPQEYVDRFAQVEGFSYTHLLATLQRRIDWNGVSVLLTGISNEVAPPDHKKPSMIFTIKPGTVYLGYETALQAGLKRGDTAAIGPKEFVVDQVLQETGSEDDVRVYMHLSDVQDALNMQGLINEIKALDCMCTIPTDDPMGVLRAELEQVLPEAKMFHIRSIAKAREDQRQMMDRYFAFLIPTVTAVCAVWIGALAMLNTRERRQEIGVFRSLGYSSGTIASLFIGKALLIGLFGAVIGFAAGTYLSLEFGPEMFRITSKNIVPIYDLLGWALVYAPLFTAVSGFIPAMAAVAQDPAETLREM